MSEQKLQQLLTELHTELGKADTLDPGARQLVEEIRDDLARLRLEDHASHAEGLTARLENASLRIESAHPRLALTLGEIVDALARIGI